MHSKYYIFKNDNPDLDLMHIKLNFSHHQPSNSYPSVFIALCDATVSHTDSRGSPFCLNTAEYMLFT